MTAPDARHRAPPPSRWRPHLALWVWAVIAAVVIVVALVVVLAMWVSYDPQAAPRAASIPTPSATRFAYTPQTLPPLNVPTLAVPTTAETENLLSSVLSGRETSAGPRTPTTAARRSTAYSAPSTAQLSRQLPPAKLPVASPTPTPAPKTTPAPAPLPAPAPVVEQPPEPAVTPEPSPEPEPTKTTEPTATATPEPTNTTERTLEQTTEAITQTPEPTP